MKIKLKKKLVILTFILVICLQNIGVFFPKINTLGLIKTKAIAQEPIPTIQVNCSQNDSQKIVFSWIAENSDYVLIEGYDDKQHPLVGSIEGSGMYDFIAVGSQDIVRELKSCVFNSSSPTAATETTSQNVGQGNTQSSVQAGSNASVNQDLDGFFAINGSEIPIRQILESSFPIDFSTLSKLFLNSYQTTAKTVLSTGDIEERVLELLQNWKYLVSSKIYNEPTLNNNIYLRTNSSKNEKLCLDDDCNKPIKRRKIIRRISFEVWLAKKNNNAYSIKIKPSVFMNYPKANNKWEPDPNTDEVSLKIRQELADEIKKKISQVS